MFVNLFTLPIVRTNLVVSAKIALDTKWNSKSTMTNVLAFLIFATGIILRQVLSYTAWKYYELYLLSLAIPAVISSKDLLSVYTKLISKYKALQNSCGALLFVLSFDLGLKLIDNTWLFFRIIEKYETPLIFATSNGLIVLGAFSLLSVLTTLAHDAYAKLFLHQRKLR